MLDFLLCYFLIAIFTLLATLMLVQSILSGMRGEKYTMKAIVAALSFSVAWVVSVIWGVAY